MAHGISPKSIQRAVALMAFGKMPKVVLELCGKSGATLGCSTRLILKVSLKELLELLTK